MDQSAHPEMHRMNAGPGSFEPIEPSRAFLRPGIATGIDSLRRPALQGPPPLRSVTLRHADPRTTTIRSANGRGQHEALPDSPSTTPLNRRLVTELKFRTRLYQ